MALDLELDLFATPPEVAALFRVDARTIRHAVEKGEIPGTRIRGTYRIPTAWVRTQLATTT